MFEVRAFSPADLREFAANAAEYWIRPHLQEIDFDALAAGPAWTCYWNGSPVACGGFVIAYPGSDMRATAWGILVSKLSREVFAHVHRAAKAGVRHAPYRRIEAQVDVRLKSSQRWIKALGFHVETPLKPCWSPDGSSVVEFARIKG